MSERQKKKIEALVEECWKKAKNSSRICNFPGCEEKAIRSHIFQKNGILSSIANKGHLIVHEGDAFDENTFIFKSKGINKAFSFDCFCAKHDLELFKEIESVEVDRLDFGLYRNCLLFTMRGVYNELNSKNEVIKFFECLKKNEKVVLDKRPLMLSLMGNKQGKKDLSAILKDFWENLENGTEDFVFRLKHIRRIELCLSSSIIYETTDELVDYRMKNREDKERITPMFFNLLPTSNKSILLVGYYKKDHDNISSYIDGFFGEDEESLEINITNLILFRCETWVCSEYLYLKKMKVVESYFRIAKKFACDSTNERQVLPINIFSENFEEQIDAALSSFKERW